MAGSVDVVERLSELPSECVDEESEEVTEEGRRGLWVSLLRTLERLLYVYSDTSEDEEEAEDTRFRGVEPVEEDLMLLLGDLLERDGLDSEK